MKKRARMSKEIGFGLEQLNMERKQITQSAKTLNEKIAEIHEKMIPEMMKCGTTYIDAESKGPGTGPWFMLDKGPQKGVWNKERQVKFFRKFFEVQRSHPQEVDTAKKASKCMKHFLREFEKRKIVMRRKEQPQRFWTVEELTEWVKSGKDPEDL